MEDKQPNTRKAYQKSYKESYKKTHKSVNVTLSLKEYNRLVKLAEQQNTKPTTLMRELAFAQMDKQAVYPTELIEQLKEHNRLIRNIANNLNQLAHHANIFSEVDKKTVFDHLRELHTTIADFSKRQAFNANQEDA